MAAAEEERGRVEAASLNKVLLVAEANLAQGFLHLRCFEGARTHAEAALRLHPENVKARYRLSQALIGLGECESAEAELSKLEGCGERALASRGRVMLRDRLRAERKESQAMAARMFGAEPAVPAAHAQRVSETSPVGAPKPRLDALD